MPFFNEDVSCDTPLSPERPFMGGSIEFYRGPKGEDGHDGVDGISPTVDVASISGGHRVTITDADGEHEFDVMDGEDSFDIHSLTVEHSIDNADELPFYDFSEEAPRKTTWGNFKAKLKSYFDTLYLGTTALVGYATQVWVQSQGYGTYTKPTGGIPKTDLSSAVQTSLGKADSALQEHQNIYELDALPNAPDDFYIPVAEAPDGDNKRLSFDSLKVKLKTYFDTLYNKVTKTSDLTNDSGYITDAPSDSKEYARKNGAWAEVVGGGGGAWGSITGTLSNQTDLKNALDSKLNASEIKLDPNNRVYKIGSNFIAAEYDGNGAVISSTYAKKTELPSFGMDPDEHIYKINNALISATYDDELNNIADTYAKKTELSDYAEADKVVPLVLGDLDGGHTIADSDYIPMAEAPDGDAQKVNVGTFKQYINNGMASQDDLEDYALQTQLITSRIDLSPTDAYEPDYNTQKDVNNHLHSKEAEWDAKLDASDLDDYALKTDLTQLQTKTITDSAGYFTTDTVEGALAEIGAELAGINTLIGSGVIV